MIKCSIKGRTLISGPGFVIGQYGRIIFVCHGSIYSMSEQSANKIMKLNDNVKIKKMSSEERSTAS